MQTSSCENEIIYMNSVIDGINIYTYPLLLQDKSNRANQVVFAGGYSYLIFLYWIIMHQFNWNYLSFLLMWNPKALGAKPLLLCKANYSRCTTSISQIKIVKAFSYTSLDYTDSCLVSSHKHLYMCLVFI